MSLALSKVAQLKPEIQLARALSEFEAVLHDDQKARFRVYKSQTPPGPVDVMRFTAEIDRDHGQKTRRCVGPRLTNLLQSVQQFSTVIDLAVGGSQNLMAGSIWGALKMSLQVRSTQTSR